MVNGWLQYTHPETAHRDQEGNITIPWFNADSDSESEFRYQISNSLVGRWKLIKRASLTSGGSDVRETFTFSIAERTKVISTRARPDLNPRRQELWNGRERGRNTVSRRNSNRAES
jgi:hypothetical protein